MIYIANWVRKYLDLSIFKKTNSSLFICGYGHVEMMSRPAGRRPPRLDKTSIFAATLFSFEFLVMSVSITGILQICMKKVKVQNSR